MRIGLVFLLALLGVPLAGCGDEDEPERTVSAGGAGGRDGGADGGRGGSSGDGAGGRGARGGSSGGGGSGGSESDGGLDAGDADAAVMGLVWCDDVEPAPLDTGELDPAEVRNGVTAPRDFVVTRAHAVWEAGCGLPVLRITLSEGGCPVGNGHELTFLVPSDGVESSTLVIGQNVIMEEPAPNHIRVRYTRPSRRFSDDGEWGTCEGASGTLDVLEELNLEKNRRLKASFMLELTRCDGETPASVRTVNGTFNIRVPDSLDDLCP